jgi:biopolymer transport protein ExbD/biopolymer transport protein TolR
MSFGRLEKPEGSRPMSDINMTPLIDVMLVLLVIFMIAAPLMTASLRLDLPQSEAAPSFVAVAITPDGKLHLGEDELDAQVFQQRIGELGRANPQLEVQLRADRAVPYGQVAELIGWVQAAGLNRIAFVAQQP